MKINFKKTESTRFILPMIHPDLNADFFLTDNFVNCYIGDPNKPTLNNAIFLVYNYINSIKFIQHEKILIKFDTYLTDYDYDDTKQTVYAFKTLPEFQSDKERIMNGEYTAISAEYKYRLLRFWNVGVNSSFFGLLYNTPIIKKYWLDLGKRPEDNCKPGEYWYTPVLEQETLKT